MKNTVAQSHLKPIGACAFCSEPATIEVSSLFENGAVGPAVLVCEDHLSVTFPPKPPPAPELPPWPILARHALRNAIERERQPRFNWAVARDLFNVGSTTGSRICLALDINPDKMGL